MHCNILFEFELLNWQLLIKKNYSLYTNDVLISDLGGRLSGFTCSTQTFTFI